MKKILVGLLLASVASQADAALYFRAWGSGPVDVSIFRYSGAPGGGPTGSNTHYEDGFVQIAGYCAQYSSSPPGGCTTTLTSGGFSASGQSQGHDGLQFSLNVVFDDAPVTDPADGMTRAVTGSGFAQMNYYNIGYDAFGFTLSNIIFYYDNTPPPSAGQVYLPTFTVAVPEPATWALMIGGFAIAGAAMRRRRVAYAWA